MFLETLSRKLPESNLIIDSYGNTQKQQPANINICKYPLTCEFLPEINP